MQQKQTHSRKLNNTLGIHEVHTAYRYNYNNDRPNTIESIYDEESGLSKYYKWDGKGNMTDRYDEQNKTNTKMCWTEDNRMQAYVQMNEGTGRGGTSGLTSLELRMGAHWNSLTNPSSNGYERQFDSRDDQFSIQKGVEHANKHDYKNKYYHVIADPSKFRDNGY